MTLVDEDVDEVATVNFVRYRPSETTKGLQTMQETAGERENKQYKDLAGISR